MSKQCVTYRVDAAELLRRTYLVTTSGGEARAAELAETGDYGLTTGETVELLEDHDRVCDFSIIDVTVEEREETPAA
jgi:hypothetical protein